MLENRATLYNKRYVATSNALYVPYGLDHDQTLNHVSQGPRLSQRAKSLCAAPLSTCVVKSACSQGSSIASLVPRVRLALTSNMQRINNVDLTVYYRHWYNQCGRLDATCISNSGAGTLRHLLPRTG